MGFEINSVIGNNMDYIYFDRLMSNSINWLTGLPTVYVKEWPSPYNSASLFIPAITENPNNINNLVNILRTYEYPVSFYVDQKTAKENPELINSLKIYGDVNPIVDIGHKTSVDDTVNKILNLEEQEKKMAGINRLFYNKMGEKAKGIMPKFGYYDENTLQSMLNNKIKYLITDSLTDRAVPRLEIRGNEPLLIITKTASDDKIIINDYGLTDKKYQLYTYEEDIDRIIFEGGLYVLKLHTDVQLKPEYVDVVKEIFKYIQANKMWITSTKKMDNWWQFKSGIELRYEIRSSKRISLEVSSPDYETRESFVIQLNINKPVENVIVSSDIINMEIPAYEYNEDEQVLYLYFDGFAEDETRSFLIDYENI
jgi:hypothetical protein